MVRFVSRQNEQKKLITINEILNQVQNKKKKMKNILNRLINQESISSDEAKNVLVKISEGQYNQSQIASFLTIYMMRSITLEELQGFRDALLELCIPINLCDFNTIDLCGTGGDGKDTFNISTLASFITAGAGVKVAKHGNYGVSSASGSSNDPDRHHNYGPYGFNCSLIDYNNVE